MKIQYLGKVEGASEENLKVIINALEEQDLVVHPKGSNHFTIFKKI